MPSRFSVENIFYIDLSRFIWVFIQVYTGSYVAFYIGLYGLRMGFLVFLYGFHMGLYVVFYMGFIWVTYGVLSVFIWGYMWLFIWVS